jgi:inward rectifier potassium channel
MPFRKTRPPTTRRGDIIHEEPDMKTQHQAKNRKIRTTIQSRTGSMNLEKLGVSRFDLMDPYHFALTLSWPEFFAVLVVAYLTINVGFAMFYFAVPGSITNLPPGSPLDAFFFSVETLATVGYGYMVPATRYGHTVATVEIFTGMLFTATMTGLVFVRFSKPKAKIIFADSIVVTQHGDRPTLMVRIGNGRLNALTDAVARLTVLMIDTRVDGSTFRRALDLKLTRTDFPFFPLTWTVMHEIDDASPLRGLTPESAHAAGLRLMLSISARDPSLGAQVYAAQNYRDTDVMFGMRYADAVSWDGHDTSVADMRKISAVEPDASAQT